MLNKIGGFIKNNYRRFIFGVFFIFVIGVFYGYKLNTIPKTGTLFESPAYLGVLTFNSLLENLVFGPIKFLQFSYFKFTNIDDFWIRLTSIIFITVALIVFYRLILKWQTKRIALLTTLLLGTSTIALSFGRFSVQETMYFLVLPSLLLIGTWLRTKKHINRIAFALPALAILFYIPGTILLSVFFIIFFRKRLMAAWRFSDLRYRLIGLSGFILLLVPAIYGLVRYPAQALAFFGIDRLINEGIIEVGRSFIGSLNELFFRGINQPEVWLYQTPVFDIVTLVFLVLGIYAFTKSEHTLRARMLFGLGIFSLVVISLGTYVSVALVVPLVFIFISKGLAFLLQNWFIVFPKNPAARSIGLILFLIPILLSVFYNVNRYYIAWPSSSETIKVLNQKQ